MGKQAISLTSEKPRVISENSDHRHPRNTPFGEVDITDITENTARLPDIPEKARFGILWGGVGSEKSSDIGNNQKKVFHSKNKFGKIA
jgi:hypothetical protein